MAKKNYLNKLFNKENIKTNKINIKILEFLGVAKIKKTEDTQNNNTINNNINNNINNTNNNNIKEKYENGLEVEINYEEKEELVKTFENEFFKSL